MLGVRVSALVRTSAQLGHAGISKATASSASNLDGSDNASTKQHSLDRGIIAESARKLCMFHDEDTGQQKGLMVLREDAQKLPPRLNQVWHSHQDATFGHASKNGLTLGMSDFNAVVYK